MRWIVAAITTLVCGLAAAQQPSIDIEGTLVLSKGRIQLRYQGDYYELRFPSSTMAQFAKDSLGTPVEVKGTLDLRVENSSQRAVITPATIDRTDTGESSIASGPALPPLRETVPAEAVTRESRTPAPAPDVSLTPQQVRQQRRRAAAEGLPRRYRGYNGSEISINPSGTMIIH